MTATGDALDLSLIEIALADEATRANLLEEAIRVGVPPRVSWTEVSKIDASTTRTDNYVLLLADLSDELLRALINLKVEQPSVTVPIASALGPRFSPSGQGETGSIWTATELLLLQAFSGWSTSDLLIAFPIGDPTVRQRFQFLQLMGDDYCRQLAAVADGGGWSVTAPWTLAMTLTLMDREPIEDYWGLPPQQAAETIGMVMPPGSGPTWYRAHLFEYAAAIRDGIDLEAAGLAIARRWNLSAVPDAALRAALGPGAPYGKNALVEALQARPVRDRWLLTDAHVGLGMGDVQTWFPVEALRASIRNDGCLPGYPSDTTRLSDPELVDLLPLLEDGKAVLAQRVGQRRLWADRRAQLTSYGHQASRRVVEALTQLQRGLSVSGLEPKLYDWIVTLPALMRDTATGQLHTCALRGMTVLGSQLQTGGSQVTIAGWLQMLTA